MPRAKPLLPRLDGCFQIQQHTFKNRGIICYQRDVIFLNRYHKEVLNVGCRNANHSFLRATRRDWHTRGLNWRLHARVQDR